MREQLIQAPDRGPRLTTVLRSVARTSIEYDCQQAGLLLQSSFRWPPRSAAPISNCWDELSFMERLSIHARMAQPPSRSGGKTRGYCSRDLRPSLARVALVGFPGPALRMSVWPSMLPLLASVHRMSRPFERMLSSDHERKRHR